MKRKLYDLVHDAGNVPIVLLGVGSLWAPVLWLIMMALEDGSNLIDLPSERYFLGQTLYQLLLLLTGAAFVNLSLWLVRRRFPGLAITLWILSVGISGLLLFGVGLLIASCESGDIFSCSGFEDMTPFTLFVSGLMAAFTVPGWIALGISRLRVQAE